MKILMTPEFIENRKAIKDIEVAVAVTKRLARVEIGNFGDAKSIGDNISELRIHQGSGYRIYYSIRGKEIILLLCAGPKSDQEKDIKKQKK